MGFRDVDGDEVRELARLETAHVLLHPERLGPAQRGDAHALLRVEDGDVAFDGALQEEHRAHLAEHVHDVAGGGAVGAQTDSDSLVEHVGHGRHPAAQLGVALGAVGDRDPLRLQGADVVDRHLDAVHGEEVRIEDVPLQQVLDGCDAEWLNEHTLPAHLLAEVVRQLAGAGAHVGQLVPALGDVAHHSEAPLAGQL